MCRSEPRDFNKMAKKRKNRPAPGTVKRLSFPEDEAKKSWLKLLLEGYHTVDKGVSKAISEERKKGRKLACCKGCSTCCVTHKDIPIYPLELTGIIWYVNEKISGGLRDVLKKQLSKFKKSLPCPFIVDNACSIHPMRPMACRQFNVFGSQCTQGEDPFHTRRDDVMDPVKKYVDQAFYIMLPFYGVEKESERISIVEAGDFHKMVRELHSCNWQELAEKMERRDKKR